MRVDDDESGGASFTGTQYGMTDAQKKRVARILRILDPMWGHVGDCIGADEEFYQIFMDVLPHSQLCGHPPINPDKRANCGYDVEQPPGEYKDRDYDIVIHGAYLIATPRSANWDRIPYSGTRLTINIAKKLGRNTHIVLPDGSLE